MVLIKEGFSMDTFEAAVEAFEAASTWLGDEHAVAVMTLRKVAAELDSGDDLSAALLGQFNLCYRALQKQAPATDETSDPLEAALRDATA